ncbi:hypothetical protein EM595_2166 [Duffyella gerundensis]|uniref:Uncharacterized protein n=1 Tax=Duffyella gerundensis TaxID=1619313 RepID=A0A0U5L5G7_9GAMM|nr:hypothetical protein EM595_2166 [Duffyella gerundensis]
MSFLNAEQKKSSGQKPLLDASHVANKLKRRV